MDPAPRPPAFTPTPEGIAASNPGRLMARLGFPSWEEFHAFTVRDRAGYWREMLSVLGIAFRFPPVRLLDVPGDVERARWLPGARLNIAESCFGGEPDSSAVVAGAEDGALCRTTLGELSLLSSRVALGLASLGLRPGDAVAVDLPLGAEAVAIYLGIVKAGMAVVGVADSFAPEEIALRLRIAGAKAVFTQDGIRRDGKTLPLFARVVAAGAPRAVVLPSGAELAADLREGDLPFAEFLPPEDAAAGFEAVPRDPEDVMNVLFSSGTTGEPKAIPWTHVTPIKCAADAWLHQDVRPGDVVAWPTSLGWMMGPWLVFAALVNRATIALYEGAPTGRGFCRFVRDAGVTMLGLVPSLVKAWRSSGALEGIDWTGVRLFSSTGETSAPDDMAWLMARAGGRPVIEYCGGTEIGGGYVTGTVVQPAVPGAFSTPAAGLDLVILDEEGRPAEEGEAFLVPPSIGLSARLVNRDHHEVYHEGCPRGPRGEVLRRHGDRLERLPGGYWRAQGRADDTMNLGGIKVGSAEIERACLGAPGLAECAAVAVPPPGGGPERLVVFVVPGPGDGKGEAEWLAALRAAVRTRLNPLFRVEEVRLVPALPRTASDKVMRRVLREEARDSR